MCDLKQGHEGPPGQPAAHLKSRGDGEPEGGSMRDSREFRPMYSSFCSCDQAFGRSSSSRPRAFAHAGACSAAAACPTLPVPSSSTVELFARGGEPAGCAGVVWLRAFSAPARSTRCTALHPRLLGRSEQTAVAAAPPCLRRRPSRSAGLCVQRRTLLCRLSCCPDHQYQRRHDAA